MGRFGMSIIVVDQGLHTSRRENDMYSASLSTKRADFEKVAETEPALLDFSHLRRYTLDDEQLQEEILELFRGQVQTLLSSLKASACDEAAWQMAAHTLKGSARAVGAFRLAKAAERAERNSQTPEARASSSLRIAEAAAETLAHLG